jgi:hypothetical protein
MLLGRVKTGGFNSLQQEPTWHLPVTKTNLSCDCNKVHTAFEFVPCLEFSDLRKFLPTRVGPELLPAFKGLLQSHSHKSLFRCNINEMLELIKP